MPSALLPLFRSDMQVELLGLLLLQPQRKWTLDELRNLVDAPTSSVHRELSRATDSGVIARDATMRPHLYQAEEGSPLFPPLRELLALTVGVEDRLRRGLAAFTAVRAAAIHGSWAEGRLRAKSDIDVIVVADGERTAIHQAARRIGREVGREVDASVLTPEDFHELWKERNPFLRGILNGTRRDLIGNLTDMVESSG